MQHKKIPLIFSLLCLMISVTGVNAQTQAIEGPEYFFSVTMVAPTSSAGMARILSIPVELRKIGIDSELDWISWAALGPRCTDQEVGTYDEGGYDLSFFGMSLGTPFRHPGKNLLDAYGADAIPPDGYNVMYWSPKTGKNYNNYRAQESDDIIQKILTNFNLSESKKDLIEWQKIWYDVMPNVLIYNQYEVHAVSTGLYGYDPVKMPLNSIEDVWFESDYKGNASQVVLAASNEGDTFNPVIATGEYDQYMNNPVFDGLVGITPSKEATLPSGTNRDTWMMANYNTTEYLEPYPRIAEALGTWSVNGLSYEIDVRRGIYWHDGHELDAWDVAFSFQARLLPRKSVNWWNDYNWDRDEWLRSFGFDEKTPNHGNYSFTVTDGNNDGFYERIKFHFNQTCASFETDYLGSLLLPEHILGDPVNHGFNSPGDFDPVNQWTVTPGDWASHSTTTGRTTDPGGYAGPIGCGSMIFHDYDSTIGTVSLQKFKDIKWDNITSQWVSAPGISHRNIDHLEDMPDTAKVIVSSMDAGLADMKTGRVNILDPYFRMANILDELQTEATIQTILSPENGWQAIYFNPKFVQDGVYHFQKKGVRHAISHMVPREKIIGEFMYGLGFPAYTPMPVTSWAAISETELLDYKKTLQATDNSTPESNAVTAFDEFSIDKAFDWLDTEGYDTSEWRKYTEVPTTTSTRGFLPGFEFFGVVVLIVFLTIHSILRRKKF